MEEYEHVNVGNNWAVGQADDEFNGDQIRMKGPSKMETYSTAQLDKDSSSFHEKMIGFLKKETDYDSKKDDKHKKGKHHHKKDAKPAAKPAKKGHKGKKAKKPAAKAEVED